MSTHEAFSTELMGEFRRTSRERLERIAVAWVRIEQETTDVQALDELRRELHSLNTLIFRQGAYRTFPHSHQKVP